MPVPLLDALIAGDRSAAAQLAGYRIPSEFPNGAALKLIRYRRDQIANDPSWAPYAILLYSNFYDMSARLIEGFALDPGPKPNTFSFAATASTKPAGERPKRPADDLER